MSRNGGKEMCTPYREKKEDIEMRGMLYDSGAMGVRVYHR